VDSEIPEEIQIEDLTLDLQQPALPPSPTAAGSAGADDERRQRKEPPRDAKSGPPSAGEWQEFIGGTVLRLLTEAYLHLVLFREIDESELTERERELVSLDKDDLRDMAAPMASFANKSKVARKHGRAIIALGDSYEALIDLFIWMRRVNRIAKRYRKNEPEVIIQGKAVDNGKVPGQDSTANQPGNSATGFIINRGTG
jgi:hypothetical protein